MAEEIEDLQLEIQGFASCLDKEELYSVCEKLKIEKSDFEGKSRFATVRILTKGIEKLLDKLKDEEKVAFLKQTLEMINPKTRDTETPAETSGVDEEVRQEMDREVYLQKEKQKRDLEAIQTRFAIMTGQTGVEQENPEANLGSLRPILKRDFRILGTIGSQGTRDQLSFISLSRQIESGKEKGYSDREVIDAIIKSIAPGLPLKDYLEAMRETGLPTVIKIIRAHYQEKNASELYASLSSLVQTPNEEPQNFLLRALNLREKILFASKQEGSKLKYDVAQCQSMFLHALETGLISNNLRSRMRVFIQQPDITDAELIAQLNLAEAEESERNAKLGIGYKGKAKVSKIQGGEAEKSSPTETRSAPKSKTSAPLEAKEPAVPFHEQVLSEIKALKADMTSLRQEMNRNSIGNQQGARREEPQQPQGRNRGPRQNRRGCKQCFKNGQGETCTHCWKCGDANHFSYQCSQGQGNYPQLLQRDNQ